MTLNFPDSLSLKHEIEIAENWVLRKIKTKITKIPLIFPTLLEHSYEPGLP